MSKKDTENLKDVVNQAIDSQQVVHVKLKDIGQKDVDIDKLTRPSKETHQEYWGRGLSYLAIGLIILLVGSIIGFVGIHGLATFFRDHVNLWQFLSSTDWDPTSGPNHVGALVMIVTSFLVTLLSALVATPFAVVKRAAWLSHLFVIVNNGISPRLQCPCCEQCLQPYA